MQVGYGDRNATRLGCSVQYLIFQLMLLTPHTIFAGTIGEIIDDPMTAFVLGFLSHFLLDTLPHFDTTDEGRFTARQVGLIVLDLATMSTMLTLVWIRVNPSVAFWFGALGGTLPDLLDHFPIRKEYFRLSIAGKTFHSFHERIQKKGIGLFTGISTQLLIIISSLLILIRVR